MGKGESTALQPLRVLPPPDLRFAQDYAFLVAADRQNATNLENIITAAFVVCLDTARPANPLELSRLAFHGGVNGEMLGNRWYVRT